VKSRHARLPMLVAQDVPEIDVRAAGAAAKAGPEAPPPATSPRAEDDEPHASRSPSAKRGCGCQGSGDAGGGALLVLGVMLAITRRRARS
jgi:MYXO-CTERM domain-containing protein